MHWGKTGYASEILGKSSVRNYGGIGNYKGLVAWDKILSWKMLFSFGSIFVKTPREIWVYFNMLYYLDISSTELANPPPTNHGEGTTSHLSKYILIVRQPEMVQGYIR